MVYKLYYFNIRGLAEPIRYLLAYGGAEFEDVRIERENWPSIKDTMPMKQMPVLEVDGKKFFQSVAICRYLGTKFGIAGNNLDENLEIDMAMDTFTDFRLKITAAFTAPEDKKEEAMKTLVEEQMPFYLSQLNSMADKNNGFMACKRLTWVDLYVAALSGVITYCTKDADPYEKYTALKKVVDHVESNGNIKKWIAERPVTEY